MLEPEQVAEIAREVAVANLARENIDFVMSEPAIDFEGQKALRITIVIEPGAAMQFEGDAVLNTLVEIHDRLLAAGEERFPIIEYATKEELEDVGDDQS